LRNASHQAYLNAYMDFDGLLRARVLEGPRRPETVEGGNGLVACLADSPWDSDLLGLPVRKAAHFFYREEPTPSEAAAFAARLDRALSLPDTGFATARFGFGLFPLAPALEAEGWSLGDVLNIYHADLAAAPVRHPEDAGLCEPDWDEVADRFPDPSRYFTHSRILRDGCMPPGAARRFFSLLLEQTFRGRAAVRVGIRRGGVLAGFAVGDRDDGPAGEAPGGLGFLWLIAVHPDHAGRGLSRILLAEFLARMGAANRHVEIGTQVDNLAANRLYQGAGLKPVSNALTFHRWYRP
jgi:ribosomal protein S18 acetylase RimI-like enzyme